MQRVIGILIIMGCLYTLHNCISREPIFIEPPPPIYNSLGWHKTDEAPMPIDIVVVGMWQVGKSRVYREVVDTMYGGPVEWWGEGVKTWACERRPDYWTTTLKED